MTNPKDYLDKISKYYIFCNYGNTSKKYVNIYLNRI